MPKLPLHSFRQGWQSENLARYILSKFSFIAEPSNISDDLGSDFFCTLFKIVKDQGKEYLFPRNSFAIQIKSIKTIKKDNYRIPITNKINYLEGLEVPFFIGVVDRDDSKLTIYSGEEIVHFLTKSRENNEIIIRLVDSIQEKNVIQKMEDGEEIIGFPKLMEIDVKDNYEKISEEIDKLFNVCDSIHENIASRKTKEYIYKTFTDEQYNNFHYTIYSGKDSYSTYEENFILRLAEAFYNLNWSYNSEHFDLNEFNIYEKIYHDFKKHYTNKYNKDLPEILTHIYEILKKKLSYDIF